MRAMKFQPYVIQGDRFLSVGQQCSTLQEAEGWMSRFYDSTEGGITVYDGDDKFQIEYTKEWVQVKKPAGYTIV